MIRSLRDHRLRAAAQQAAGDKDHHEPVVINLPHCNTPELVEAVLPLWLRQTHPTLIDVVDTGSRPRDLARLAHICEAAGPRVRLHVIAPRTWRHSSEPVAVACELSQLYAETPRVLWSHVDVFPRRPDLVAHWVSQCDARTPVVGYEISPRDHVSGWISTNWPGMLGHSLTMGYLPALRACSWSYMVAAEEFGLGARDLLTWDTEVTFNLCLQRAGINRAIIGHDRNYEHLVDEWHGHARSYPGAVISGAEHAEKARPWVDEEIKLARINAERWTKCV